MRILVLCALVTFSALGTLAVGKPDNRSPAKPTVQEIQLYHDAREIGRINVNLPSRKIEEIYRDYESRPPSWMAVEDRLTSNEVKRLSQLARSDDLRRFRPQSKWFQGSMPPPDSGATLAIVWSDKTVSLAIPPYNMRSKLSSTAKQRYKEIDRIVELLMGLTKAHLKSSLPRRLESNSAAVKAYLADRDKVSRSSQPRGRRSW